MDWKDHIKTIRKAVPVDTRLDENPNTKYKIVEYVPSINRSSFRIKVGAKNFIEIPLEMLEQIFLRSIGNEGLYNKSIIETLYSAEVNAKPCLVQAVGKIFAKAGITKQISSRNYMIINND